MQFMAGGVGATSIIGVGFAAGVGAALCYGSGSVLQAVGAQRTETAVGLDPHLLLRLLRRLPYVLGLALDLVGFGCNIVALQSLPLFLVQAMIASSVGVTAVVATRVLHVRLSRGSVVALIGLLVGLVLLAAGARPGSARALPVAGGWVLAGMAVLLALLALLASRLSGRVGVVTIAAVAGAAFGGVGVAARGLELPHPLWWILTMPVAWALVGFGLLGTLAFATALQRGSVTVASAVMFAVETVLPAAVGLAFMGDATRPGLGVPAAAAGFVFTVGAAIALARYAEPLPLVLAADVT